MGNLAVLASGSGSNFQAICEALIMGPHVVVGLLCDQPGAHVLTRAEVLHVPSVLVPYDGSTDRSKQVTERRMELILREWRPDIIALAGFMRVLSPAFVKGFSRRIVNIHPSLLPNYRGLNAIRRSYEANEAVVGITVHFVDDGVDTGEIIRQETLARREGETLTELEIRIHELEHRTYPEVIQSLLAESSGFSGKDGSV
ncbi:MAG: phosphoribosylglycinamide formyltransferase [Spirochaetaceae bacterium]|nr:phosphoribosylglycinamide formyltransferase [Spirochaetaceae bacterium]